MESIFQNMYNTNATSEGGDKFSTMFCGLGNGNQEELSESLTCPRGKSIRVVYRDSEESEDCEDRCPDNDLLEDSLKDEIKNLRKDTFKESAKPEDIGRVFGSAMKSTLPLFKKIMEQTVKSTPPTTSTKMFRKSDFCDVVKKKREEFVFNNFSQDVEKISNFLREQAAAMEVCNFSYVFTIPKIYDITSVETILREYFRDCGYTTSTKQGDEKESIKTITLYIS